MACMRRQLAKAIANVSEWQKDFSYPFLFFGKVDTIIDCARKMCLNPTLALYLLLILLDSSGDVHGLDKG